MRRILCIWFPSWPLQRRYAARPELREQPVVLYEEGRGRGGCRVAACCARAAEHGIVPGMPLAEAEAMGRQGDKETGRRSERRPSRNFSLSPPLLVSLSCGPKQHALHLERHDPTADRSALEQLAEWCQRFSPIVAIEEAQEEPESLLLDITGCERLFHGEEQLARQVVRELARRGFTAYVAVADTIGAAWALARWATVNRAASVSERVRRPLHASVAATGTLAPAHPLADARGSDGLVVPSGQTASALASLPVEALRMEDETVRLLRELGIEQIAQVESLPRDALTARFGPGLLKRLDQVMGRAEEVLVPHRPPPPAQAIWSFEHPTARREVLLAVLERLIEHIAEQLWQQHQGVQQLHGWLELESLPPCLPLALLPSRGATAGLSSSAAGKCDGLLHPLADTRGPVIEFCIELFQPTASSRHLMELVRTRLEQLALHAPASAVRVQATVTGPLQSTQQQMFESPRLREGRRQLAVLIDRLISRLGRRRVLRARLVPDAQPEYTCRYAPLVGETARQQGGEAARRRQITEPRTSASGFGVRSHLSAALLDKPAVAPSTYHSALSTRHSALVSPSPSLTRRPLRLRARPLPVAVVSVVPEGPPILLRWAGREHRIVHAWGPERIETGWWRRRGRGGDKERGRQGDRAARGATAGLPSSAVASGATSSRSPYRLRPVRRDYYLVQTESGQRFWLFRRLYDSRWFLHGWFE